MDPWPFVVAAYAISAVTVAALTIGSWLAMRRAEAQAQSLAEALGSRREG